MTKLSASTNPRTPHTPFFFLSLWLKLKKKVQGTYFSHLVENFINKSRTRTVLGIVQKTINSLIDHLRNNKWRSINVITFLSYIN